MFLGLEEFDLLGQFTLRASGDEKEQRLERAIAFRYHPRL
jgi:hypothetical protein